MNFPLALLRTLWLQPHRGLAALYWYLTGRKVRARNRLRLATAQSPNAYSTWIKSVENLKQLRKKSRAIMVDWTYRPKFTVVLYINHAVSDSDCIRTVHSVQRQFYSDWEIILVRHKGMTDVIPIEDSRICYASDSASNVAEALNIGIVAAAGDYILPLAAGDELSPSALFRFGQALQTSPRPAVLYGDEDSRSRRGRRRRPWFKPDWNEEMFLAQDYISACCLLDMRVVRGVDPLLKSDAPVAVYALILRTLAANPLLSIVHIAHVLCHRHVPENNDNQSARLRVVACHLDGSGAKVLAGRFGSLSVVWPLPEPPPLVSIIVPTRDKVHLLRKCVEGVLTDTRYPCFELLIVDNDSVEHATHRYFDELERRGRVKILRFRGAYNYSAINNYAAAQARGRYICLLNNDTEVIDSEWLTEMMRHAVRPHVGAVGAKLIYGDGSIQHAGVIVGIGDAAGHAHRFLRKGEAGYFNQPHLTQYMSAVTAACLVVERRKFDAVGGLDADNLAVAFNDVDLCLKLDAAGWRNVYVPQAVLIHHESKSRGRDASPEHIQRYLGELAILQERWATKTFADPRHNPNLSRDAETFLIKL